MTSTRRCCLSGGLPGGALCHFQKCPSIPGPSSPQPPGSRGRCDPSLSQVDSPRAGGGTHSQTARAGPGSQESIPEPGGKGAGKWRFCVFSVPSDVPLARAALAQLPRSPTGAGGVSASARARMRGGDGGIPSRGCRHTRVRVWGIPSPRFWGLVGVCQPLISQEEERGAVGSWVAARSTAPGARRRDVGQVTGPLPHGEA